MKKKSVSNNNSVAAPLLSTLSPTESQLRSVQNNLFAYLPLSSLGKVSQLSKFWKNNIQSLEAKEKTVFYSLVKDELSRLYITSNRACCDTLYELLKERQKKESVWAEASVKLPSDVKNEIENCTCYYLNRTDAFTFMLEEEKLTPQEKEKLQLLQKEEKLRFLGKYKEEDFRFRDARDIDNLDRLELEDAFPEVCSNSSERENILEQTDTVTLGLEEEGLPEPLSPYFPYIDISRSPFIRGCILSRN